MWKGRRRDGELVCSGGEVLWTPSDKGQRRQSPPPQPPPPPPAEHRTGGAWGKACGSLENIQGRLSSHITSRGAGRCLTTATTFTDVDPAGPLFQLYGAPLSSSAGLFCLFFLWAQKPPEGMK